MADGRAPAGAERGGRVPDLVDERRVLVLVGTELRTREHHDLLAIGPTVPVATRDLDTPEAVRLLKSLGAAVFVVHPQGCRQMLSGAYRHAWSAWDLPEYDGIEIWDYMHDWVRALRLRRLPRMCRHPEAFIHGPEPEILAAWDEVARTRPLAGLSGLDVHAKRLPWGLDRWAPWARGGVLPYARTFAALAHYALVPGPWTGNAARDTQAVAASLAAGRGWTAREELAPGRAFRFRLREGDNAYPPGARVPLAAGQVLEIESPHPARLRLVGGGAIKAETEGTRLAHAPRLPGAYRAEGYLDGQAWVFTNHIYVREPGE